MVAPSYAAPSDADLSGIGLLHGALNPSFSSGTTSYTVSVPRGTSATKVWIYASDANATMTINGDPVLSGGGVRHHQPCSWR
jgi:hypothetical protein